MSSPRQAAIVSRDYRPTPDACTHALCLLLQTSFNSQTRKGGSHDLTKVPTPKTVKKRTTENRTGENLTWRN
jgi:hypothetical protein